MSGACTEDGLPVGWRIELDASTRVLDGGTLLAGGNPFRLLRLSALGQRWLEGVLAGERLGAGRAERALARRLTDGGLALPIPEPSTRARDDVAVVLPVRDDATGLRRTLATLGDVGQVVVVDDGSADPDEIVAAAAGHTVLRNDESIGPGGARERGWRSCDAPLIAFVDADVELEPGCLDRILADLDDDGVDAVAPRIRSRSGPGFDVLNRFERSRSPLDLGPIGGPVRPQARVSYVPTTMLVVRRASLEDVGGFDPALRVGEDVDLVWRMASRGGRIRYDPAAVATHPCRPTALRWLAQRVKYGSSAAALSRRHGAAMAPLSVSLADTAPWALLTVGRPDLAALATVAVVGGRADRLRRRGVGATPAVDIAAGSVASSARLMADAVRRPWWPVAAVLAARLRSARPVLVAVAIAPSVLEWRDRRPALDPLRYVVLRLVEDLAYGVGVWWGCIVHRSSTALRPVLTSPSAQRQSTMASAISGWISRSRSA